MTESGVNPRAEMAFPVRPLFEGCNVGTWIGFKHILYLLEDGVRRYLQAIGLPTGRLFEQHGICTEIAAIRARLTHAVRCDDELHVVVAAKAAADPRGPLQVRLVGADGIVRASGAVTVAWRRDAGQAGGSDPEPLRNLIVGRDPVAAAAPPADAARLVSTLVPAGKAFHVAAVRVPYPSCSFNFWLQSAGYHRLVESMVDWFLHERGISIGTLLDERRWIPVVSQVAVTIHADVRLEETLFATLVVDDVLKDVLFRSSLRFHVFRDGAPRLVAESAIDHAYVEFTTRAVEPRVATFDGRVRQALTGERA
jgi:acyl-CoA thioesterase FadM